jgi:hypothetical protein
VRHLALSLALVACQPKPIPDADGPSGAPGARRASTEAPANAFAPERHRHDAAPPHHGAPPSATLDAVAVTDEGDAAITVDQIGDLRLWPTLDGRREPVPVHGAHPVSLAIGHVGDELVATGLDEAGAVTLLRMSRGGGMIDRVQLPAEVKVMEVAIVGGHVLVRRADQTIDAYDAYGTARGHLAPGPGERIDQLVVRHGTALAVASIADGPSLLHWIAMPDAAGVAGSDDALAWGRTVPLAIPAARVALSPEHDRIAVVSSLDGAVSIVALDTMKPIGTLDTLVTAANNDIAIGFIDEDHVAATDRGQIQWWTAPQPPAPPPPEHPVFPTNPVPGSFLSSVDPWAGTTPTNPSVAVPPQQAAVGPQLPQQQPVVRVGSKRIARNFGDEAAVADGMLVSSTATSLTLTTPTAVHYLGYEDIPDGRLVLTGGQLVEAAVSNRTLWLDSDLHPVSSYQTPSATAPGTWMLAPLVAGPHQVVLTTMAQNYTTGNADGTLELVDTEGNKPNLTIGKLPAEQLGTLVVQGDVLMVHSNTSTARYRLDVDAWKVSELAPLATVQGEVIHLTDPSRTDGIAAYVGRAMADGFHVMTFREGPAGSHALIQGTPSKPISGFLFGFDDDGNAYAITAYGAEVFDRAGTSVARIKTTGLNAQGAIGRDGKLAFLGMNEVIGLDRGGERWRVPAWQPLSATFTPDGTRLIVGLRSGFVVLDPRTGERISTQCGWNFGVWDSMPSTREFGEAPICAE